MEKSNSLPVSAWSGFVAEPMARQLLAAVAGAQPARPVDPGCVRRDVTGQFVVAGKAADARFLPPEGDKGEPSVVWSLGATVYSLVMGRPLSADLSCIPALPPRKGSRALDALLRRCLDPDPAQRPTLAQVAEEAARDAAPRRLKGEFVPEMADTSFWKEEML